jgi:hypothetical protein
VIAAVQDLARTWRYEPARRAGVAVPSRTFVVIELDDTRLPD